MLVCMLLPMSVYAQRLDIHGVITDEAGEPVPGVAVLVKGTVMGTDSQEQTAISATPMATRARSRAENLDVFIETPSLG